MKSRDWFASQGWSPLPFQTEVWTRYAAGESGLVHSSTGSGKTYAVWLGLLNNPPTRKGLKAIWITPLRALAHDTLKALQTPLEFFGLDWNIEMRTGDTSSHQKKKQFTKMPDGLVTTPETLSLLLSEPTGKDLLENLELIVVDEWHELLGSKRGTQTELALARLRKWNPKVRTWGLSATLGNIDEAARVLGVPQTVKGEQDKEIIVDSILPKNLERFPWAGHLGSQMIPLVAEELENVRSALIFTNTRSQAEIWYQALLMLKPEWENIIGLHHGSLDREERTRVELGLRNGELKAVVCTATLDLGVDFSPVERVFQIGSPKGVARVIQRAGRSGHQPGRPSRVTIVPTFALELIDIAAVRKAVADRNLEGRTPISKPLDVLVQHIVTIAIGGGFESPELYEEVRSAHSYKDLLLDEWQWCLDFVTKGGQSLKAYPEFHKVIERDGRFLVEDKRIALRHRMAIGTIVSDSAVKVAYLKGATLGSIEESLAGRLRKGDKFTFAGKVLEFVMMKDMTVYVKRATTQKGSVVRWAGARMALSTELALSVRARLDDAHHGLLDEPEMKFSAELLSLQNEWSALPDEDQLLIESVRTREGFHLFFYPVEGRLVHEGLAALFAYRISRLRPISFTLAANDYGFELLSPEPAPLDEAIDNDLFSTHNLIEDITGSLNATELARRQFREIARVAGLIFAGYPGAPKTNRQIQASSGLFYDVFARFEPENLLLMQADREVLEKQLEVTRFIATLERLQRSRIVFAEPPRPTPLAFPLLVDRLRESISSEALEDRIRKMVADFERGAAE